MANTVSTNQELSKSDIPSQGLSAETHKAQANAGPECKYFSSKPALKLVWNCSRPFEDERERGGFLGEIVLVKPPSITPLGEWLDG